MDKFQKVIEDMIAVFEDYLPLEQEKLKAVQEDNVAGVETCMKREQAVELKLRGLEQKRITVQKELGWDGLTFRQILEKVPQEERQKWQQLFDRLKNSMIIFQETNRSAMDEMALNLKEIEKVIKIKDPEGQYGKDGMSSKKDRLMTSRRV